MKYFSIILLLFTQSGFSQKPSVSPIINSIEFKQDTIKAIYDWVTENIRYDVSELDKRLKKNNSRNMQKTTSRKKPLISKDEENLRSVIKKKKGVCEHYSLLFDALVSELGYTSQIVHGFTKNINGKIGSDIGHAWNTVRINGEWKLYDCTWGAGYIENGKKFIQQPDDKWFEPNSNEFLKTHLPFDPIWQLSESPINFNQFKENKTSSITEVPYNYNYLISTYLKDSKIDQIKTKIERSKLTADNKRLINKWRKNNLANIQGQNINGIIDQCIAASKLFEEYGKARNKKFKDNKWTLEYSKKSLPELKNNVEVLKNELVNFKESNSTNKRLVNQSITKCKKLLRYIVKEMDFLDTL